DRGSCFSRTFTALPTTARAKASNKSSRAFATSTRTPGQITFRFGACSTRLTLAFHSDANGCSSSPAAMDDNSNFQARHMEKSIRRNFLSPLCSHFTLRGTHWEIYRSDPTIRSSGLPASGPTSFPAFQKDTIIYGTPRAAAEYRCLAGALDTGAFC